MMFALAIFVVSTLLVMLCLGCGSGSTSAPTSPSSAAPSFIVQPASQTEALGRSVTFTVAVSGTPTPELSWEKSLDGTTWTPISGATAALYTFTPVQDDQGTKYRAKAHNDRGPATSNAATLNLISLPSKTILAYYCPDYSGTFDDFVTTHAYFNTVGVASFHLNDHGVLSGNFDPDMLTLAEQKGIPVYATVDNVVNGDIDPNVMPGIASTYQTQAVANLLTLAQTNHLAGINLDFEGMYSSDRAGFSAFASALAAALHTQNMKLIVSVAAKTTEDAADDWTYPYDYAALATSADLLQIMTYDEIIAAWDPGPCSGLDWQNEVLDYAIMTLGVPPSKILNGLPAYGNDWVVASDGTRISGERKSLKEIAQLVTAHSPTILVDAASSSPYFNYSVGNENHQVWFETPASLTLKSHLVTTMNLAGTSVWALSEEDATFWNAVLAGM